jgi:uncharacterized protein YqeY
MLVDQLRDDLTAALKRRDELTVATLRLALSAVKAAEVSGKEARTLTDDEVRRVLTREARQRSEAAETYTTAGRAELADRELAERAVLTAYLPAALDEAELTALVDEVLAEGGFTAKAQMGPAMKAVNAKVAGRADGKAVAALVQARLS